MSIEIRIGERRVGFNRERELGLFAGHLPHRGGFRLAAVRPGAVDRTRQHKPDIPRTGDFGIPLRDEIDLTCPV